MKKIIIIAALFCSFSASAQYTYIAQRYEWLAGVFRALGLPTGAGPAAFTASQRQNAGAVYYDSVGADSGLYVYSGLAWRLLGEGQVTQSALDDTAAAIRGDFPAGVNIYNSDGILTGDRAVDGNQNFFSISNTLALNLIANDAPSSNYSSMGLTTTNTIWDLVNASSATKRIEMDENGISLTSDSIRIAATLAGTSAGYVWTLLNPSTGSGKWAAPSGSGSGTDSAAFNTLTQLTDTSWVFSRANGEKDTLVILKPNVVVDSIGTTGTALIVARNDSILHRLIQAGNRITVDTIATGEVRIAASGDLEEVSDHSSATDNMYIYTPENRVYYVVNGYRFPIAVTDSTAVSGYDVDAGIYMDAVEAAGGTLSGTVKGHLNDLFVGWKADGNYTPLIDGIFPIWGSAAPSLVPLKATHTFTAAGSPTFTSSGPDINGSSQFVISDIIPATHLPTENGSLFYYSQDDVTASTVDMGSATGSNRFELLSKSTGAVTLGRVWNSGNGQTSQTITSSQGFIGVVRASLSDLRVYRNGSQLGSTVTTSTTLGSRPTHAIYIGARNGDGTAAAFSSRKFSAAFILEGMTPTQVANFTTRVETFMDAMGIGVIP